MNSLNSTPSDTQPSLPNAARRAREHMRDPRIFNLSQRYLLVPMHAPAHSVPSELVCETHKMWLADRNSEPYQRLLRVQDVALPCGYPNDRLGALTIGSPAMATAFLTMNPQLEHCLRTEHNAITCFFLQVKGPVPTGFQRGPVLWMDKAAMTLRTVSPGAPRVTLHGDMPSEVWLAELDWRPLGDAGVEFQHREWEHRFGSHCPNLGVSS